MKKKPTPPPDPAVTSALADAAERAGEPDLARQFRALLAKDLQPGELKQLVQCAEMLLDRRAESEGAPQVKVKVLAGWFGIASNTIGAWVRDGFPRPEGGLYDVAAVMRWARELRGQYHKLRTRFDSLAAATEKGAELKARRLAIEVEELEGRLVSRESVALDGVRKAAQVRRELEHLPAFVEALADHEPADMRAAVETEVERILRGFADGGAR